MRSAVSQRIPLRSGATPGLPLLGRAMLHTGPNSPEDFQPPAGLCSAAPLNAMPCSARQRFVLPSSSTGLKYGRKISPMRSDAMCSTAFRSNALLCGAIQHSPPRKGRKIFQSHPFHHRALSSVARPSLALQSSADYGFAVLCKPTASQEGAEVCTASRCAAKLCNAWPSDAGLSGALRGSAALCVSRLCFPIPSPLRAEKDLYPARHGSAGPSAAMPSNANPTRAALCSPINIPSPEGKAFLSNASQAVPSSARLCAACRCNARLSHSIPSKGGKDFLPRMAMHLLALHRYALPGLAVLTTFPAHPGNRFQYELN